jgi:hypothetical protein
LRSISPANSSNINAFMLEGDRSLRQREDASQFSYRPWHGEEFCVNQISARFVYSH